MTRMPRSRHRMRSTYAPESSTATCGCRAASTIAGAPLARLHVLHVLGVHRGDAAGGRIGRQAVPDPEILEEGVLVGKVVRDVPLLETLEHGGARMRRYLGVHRQAVFRTPNQRLGQVHRVVDDVDPVSYTHLTLPTSDL